MAKRKVLSSPHAPNSFSLEALRAAIKKAKGENSE